MDFILKMLNIRDGIKMKIKIKDKKKILQFSVALLIALIIVIIAFPHILNAVFGNRIKDEIITVATDVVSEIDVECIEGKFAIYNSQGLKIYNTKGEFDREHYKSAYAPIMHRDGDFTALSDTSSTEFTVLKGDNVRYEAKAPQNIKSITVNKKGYTTIITGETGYKSLVIVYDNKGEEKYRWYSDESYAIDAKLDENSKTLAVVSVKMESNSLVTLVEQYKLNQEEVLSRTVIEDIIPYSIAFNGSKIVLIGDKKAYCISRTGKIKNEYDYKGRLLECFDMENINNISLALSEDTGATELVVLNSNLKEKGTQRCEYLVTMLDENNGKVIAAGEGSVKVITEKGRILAEGDLSKDGSFIVLSDNWRKFAVYSSGYINIFTVERGR